jgi:hypothetical protein
VRASGAAELVLGKQCLARLAYDRKSGSRLTESITAEDNCRHVENK